jgi:uncharacterized protein YgiM (DUF1202 family)
MKLPSRKSLLLILLLSFVLGVAAPGGIILAAGAEQQVQFVTPIMVVNSSFLNVRTGPGVQYNVLITVVGGTDLPVLGRANDNVWFQISTVVGVGWVNAEFVIPRGDFTNVPVVDTSIAALVAQSGPSLVGLPDGQGGGGAFAPAQGGGSNLTGLVDQYGDPIVISGPNERFRALINVEAVDLRSQPVDGSPALATLYREFTKDYPIVGSSRDRNNIDWFAIIVPDIGTGWIEAPKVFTRLSGAFRTVMVIDADSLGMGDGPGTGSTRLPVLTRGQEAFLVNISQDGKFIQIELGGGEVGWIPFGSAKQRTGTTTDGLNLTSASFVAVAPGDLGQGGGTPIGRFGLSTPHLIVNTAFLNIRSGPGAQFSPVATVPGGTELRVLGIASDRVWFLIEGSFGRGWVNQEFTIFRGVIANVPEIPLDSVAATIGVLAAPTAIISGPTVLYLAPGTNFGPVGTIPGPAQLAIVARTADGTWVQVNSTLGFGWLLTSQVLLQGDISLIPIVS